MSVKIYIEGGGKTDRLKSELRQSFQQLFIKAGFHSRLPHVVACGSRNDAYSDFKTAINNKKQEETILLLVDSEDCIAENINKWEHVKKRDSWKKPTDAQEDNIFFMVTCMESWFLADKDAVKSFYGQYFNVNALPKTSEYESIEKTTIYASLENATKKTQKGSYGKGAHSFKILALLDANKVKNHGSHTKDFFEKLNQFTS